VEDPGDEGHCTEFARRSLRVENDLLPVSAGIALARTAHADWLAVLVCVGLNLAQGGITNFSRG